MLHGRRCLHLVVSVALDTHTQFTVGGAGGVEQTLVEFYHFGLGNGPYNGDLQAGEMGACFK